MSDFRIQPTQFIPQFGKRDEEAKLKAKRAEDKHFIPPEAKVKGQADAGRPPQQGWGYMETVRLEDGKLVREHRDLTEREAARMADALALQTALIHHQLFEQIEQLSAPWGCPRADRFDTLLQDVKVR